MYRLCLENIFLVSSQCNNHFSTLGVFAAFRLHREQHRAEPTWHLKHDNVILSKCSVGSLIMSHVKICLCPMRRCVYVQAFPMCRRCVALRTICVYICSRKHGSNSSDKEVISYNAWLKHKKVGVQEDFDVLAPILLCSTWPLGNKLA